MGIVQEYLALTAKWKLECGQKTCVLLQVGSFFEIYGLRDEEGIMGSNIEDVTSKCDLLIAKKGQFVDGKQVVMAGFGLTQLDKYIKKLQEYEYTCPIYTQDHQMPNTTRSLSEIISPGTYFASDSSQVSNHSVCIWVTKHEKTRYTSEIVRMGVSAIDVNTGRSRISQFEGGYFGDSTTYDDLERQVTIISPHECIIVLNGFDKKHGMDIINYIGLSNIKTHLVHIDDKTELASFAVNAQKQQYQHEIMKRFFVKTSPEIVYDSFRTHETAMQSYILLLDFVYQRNPTILKKIMYPILEEADNTLLLANHSLRQLNILDDDRHKGKYRSITSLLDNCMTSMGTRLFRYRISNPTTSIHNLETSYNNIGHALDSDAWSSIRNNLKGVRDIDMFYRKVISNKIMPIDITQLSVDLVKIDSIITHVSTNISLYTAMNNQQLNCKEGLLQLLTTIQTTFDLSKCKGLSDISEDKLGIMSPEEACFIRPGVSKPIDIALEDSIKYSIQLEATVAAINTIIGDYEKKHNTVYVKIHETPKNDPNIIGTSRRVKVFMSALDDMKLLGKKHISIHGVDHDIDNFNTHSMGSNKKDLIISNDIIATLSSNLQTSRKTLILELEKVFREYCASLSELNAEFDNISQFVAWADCLQNACYMANKYNYCRPVIDSLCKKSYFDVSGLRHPLIEQIQTNETYVTNDLSLGYDKHGLLLYGTNAVGKSSFIKSVGIAVVMAQAGLYVPCTSMTYAPYNKIFTRILGNDNIFKGLSTFAVEMSELRTILNHADENSLVIGDELCSGTESNSARSIFTTGVEWLHSKHTSFIFATHFHEINSYTEIEDMDKLSMMHLSVTYNKEKDYLMYDRKLKDGPGEDMYGLEVCKSINLPNSFLERAHKLRIKYNPQSANTLSQGTSSFNVNKIKGPCELCGKPGKEVHHLAHQSSANKRGYTNNHHKNHPANLMNVCDKCHDKMHSTNTQHRRVKTTDGYILTEL